jgi:hypothetical protein
MAFTRTRTDPDPDARAGYAFLFDGAAKGVGDPPLAYFTGKVLGALSKADPGGKTRCQVRVGLPMLPQLSERTTAVQSQGLSSGRTVSHDMDTYKFVIWDWLDSLSDGWSSLDLERGSEIFRRHCGECVTLTALDDTVRTSVDRQLRFTPGYIGAFEIDFGSPVHRCGFVDLIYDAAIMDGFVVQEETIEGDQDWALRGAKAFRPGGLRWEPYGWLYDNGPPLPRPPASGRGAKSAGMLARKHAGRLEHRVIDAVARAFLWRSRGPSFAFTAPADRHDFLEAIMPEGKFTHYLFNPDHKEGGPKSHFFMGTLGIEPDDWRYLAAQFYEGLLLAEPEDIELREWDTGYGVRFAVYMRVRGRSGVTGIAKTGWMMRPGELPSLASAMPGDRERAAVETAEPFVLPPGARTSEDWARLWEWAQVAGARAMAETVPTPLYLKGYPAIPEGEVGLGLVRLGASEFSTWMLSAAHAQPGSSGVAFVHSPLDVASLDRGTAWAHAVARVVRFNGLEADARASAG